MSELAKRLVKIQQELKAPKSQKNEYGGYYYRSCEDILSAAKPLCAENGVYITLTDEMVFIADRVYVKATATLSDGVSSVSANAYARESAERKGMDSAQITGAASSYARKYALNGLLCIDDTKDPDATHYEDVYEMPKTRTQKPERPQVSYHQKLSEPQERYICKFCGIAVTTKVAEFSQSKFKEVYCINHQKQQNPDSGTKQPDIEFVTCQSCGKGTTDFYAKRSSAKYGEALCKTCCEAAGGL